MNCKIREASKEAIKEAYINKVPLMIWNYRKNSVFTDITSVNSYGVVEYRNICEFNLKMAQKYNLGFEFRIWKSNKDRKLRVLNRISRIASSGKAQFVTLTFSPKFLSRETTEETRRRYIRRFLKTECLEYVANVDYGEDNGREHYHAVIVPKNDKIDYEKYNEIFDKSRIYAEPVQTSQKDYDQISLYVNKLTNHALKSSGMYKRLIFSRGI